MAAFEIGSFSYTSDDAIAKYINAKSCPLAKVGTDYKYSLEKAGEVYTCTEYLKEKCISYSFKLDQETQYCVATMTQVTTRIGANQLKTIIRQNNGVVHEFTRLFTEEGMEMNVYHSKSGKRYTMMFKRFTNLNGEYKLISHNGLIEFGKALGVKDDVVKKMDADMDGRMIVEEKNGVYHHVWKSAVMPLDMSFKLGVEFDYKNPACGHSVLKGLASKKGDSILIHFKGENMQFTATLTFTSNFIIKEVQMANTGLAYKSVLAKV